MPTKSPLSIVKEKFQDKESLLKAFRELATEDLWIDRVGQEKGLDAVSNKKLLRLHTILTDVKGKFGSRAKLVEAILTQENRTKDDGRKTGLGRWSTPRLWDHYRAGEKRAKAAKA
jgi:hypothetical protein